MVTGPGFSSPVRSRHRGRGRSPAKDRPVRRRSSRLLRYISGGTPRPRYLGWGTRSGYGNARDPPRRSASARTEMFTIMKARRRSTTVVEERVSSASGLRPIVARSVKTTAVAKIIATHGCTAARVDPGEHLGQDILVCHAVDNPGGHDQVDERPVGDRYERDEREERVGIDNGLLSTIFEQRSARLGELGRRHHHRGRESYEQVDYTGGEQAAEDGAGVDPARMAHLLSDVDRVIEADQGVERKDRASQDGRKYARALLELEGPGRLTRA